MNVFVLRFRDCSGGLNTLVDGVAPLLPLNHTSQRGATSTSQVTLLLTRTYHLTEGTFFGGQDLVQLFEGFKKRKWPMGLGNGSGILESSNAPPLPLGELTRVHML